MTPLSATRWCTATDMEMPFRGGGLVMSADKHLRNPYLLCICGVPQNTGT